MSITITVELSGGLELLFANEKEFDVTLPSVELISHACDPPAAKKSGGSLSAGGGGGGCGGECGGTAAPRGEVGGLRENGSNGGGETGTETLAKRIEEEPDEYGHTVRDVIAFLADNHVKERVELFRKEDSVRPGILVLVNGADWELEGQLDCPVEDGDRVAFISTLHGG